MPDPDMCSEALGKDGGMGEDVPSLAVASNRQHDRMQCAFLALGAASVPDRFLFCHFHGYSPSTSPFEMPASAAHSAAGILPAPDGRTRLIWMRPPTH